MWAQSHSAVGHIHPPVLGSTLGRAVIGDRIGLALPQQGHTIRTDPLLLQIGRDAPHPSLRQRQVVSLGADIVGETGHDHVGLRVVFQKVGQLALRLRNFGIDLYERLDLGSKEQFQAAVFRQSVSKEQCTIGRR